MSMITFNYANLENAENILNSTRKYYDDFDRWENGDWEKNCNAIMKVIQDNLDLNIRVFKMSDGEESRFSLFCNHKKLHTRVELKEDVCDQCEFNTPLDVLRLLDDWSWDAERFYNLYIIKEN
mgnify:CR=1 FL=1